MSPEFKTLHHYIIACMKASGYKANEDGICNGFFLSGMIAFFSGKFPQFSQLLSELERYRNTNPHELLKKLQTVHEKCLNNRSSNPKVAFTDAEKKLISLRTLFEAIEFSFLPYRYREWFPNPQYVSQTDGDAIATILAPNRNIQKFLSHPSMCTKNELSEYFYQLTTLAKEKKSNFALQLGSIDHTIGLIYDAKKQEWTFINAEYNRLEPVNHFEQIVHHIFKSFHESTIVGFDTHFYGLEKDKEHLNELVNELSSSPEFKNVQNVTEERADYLTSTQVTLAILAAQDGHVTAVERLHELGRDLNKADIKGNTPAMMAALYGHTEVVYALLEANANFNLANCDGDTAAYIAARHGHAHTLFALHQGQADLNQTYGQNHLTLAMIAALHGHADVIPVLHYAGVDLNRTDLNGNTAAFMAALRGHANVIDALHQAEANLNHGSKDITPAMTAALHGHADVIIALHKAEANLNSVDQEGNTAAMLAAQTGNSEVILALGAAKADLNQGDGEGFTPVMFAAQNGHVQAIHAFHTAGADLNRADTEGNTPAIMAAHNGHAPVIHALHEGGADLTRANHRGFTPAMIAALEGHAEVIYALRSAGVTVNQADENDTTPAMIAAYRGHTDVLRALQEAETAIKQAKDAPLSPNTTVTPTIGIVSHSALHHRGHNPLQPIETAGSPDTSVQLNPEPAEHLIEASTLVEAEIQRLKSSKKGNCCWTLLHFNQNNHSKIKVLKQLKTLLDESLTSKNTRHDIQLKLCNWNSEAHQEIINKSPTNLYTFFAQPEKPRPAVVVKEIFALFDMSDDIDVYRANHNKLVSKLA